MRRLVAASTVVVLGLVAACGLDSSSGGSASLPTNGLGPFRKLPLDLTTPIEEPYVLSVGGTALADPSALADGDGFRVWFAHRTPAAATTSEIWLVHFGSDLTLGATATPALALAASEAWEAGVVGAPSVVATTDGRLLMYYGAGDAASPVIGRAHSNDDGATWQKDGVVLVGAIDPAALVVDGAVTLFTGRPDGSAIDAWVGSADGMTFASATPVLVPQLQSAAFDRAGVGQPAVAGGITVGNQLHVDLYYVGTSPVGERAIGSAGSSDGETFVRFFRGTPILDPGGEDERAPSVVLSADRAVMFFEQDRVAVPALAAASSP